MPFHLLFCHNYFIFHVLQLFVAFYAFQIASRFANTISVNIYETSVEHFKLYPNPAQDKVTININNYLGNDLTARIYSITGQLILESLLANANYTLSTAKFSKGCYIVEISNKNGFSKRKKLIIK